MRYGQTLALVTNWHVLSGINAATGETLNKMGSRPNRIECHVAVSRKVKEGSETGELLFFKRVQIDLISGETPVWGEKRLFQMLSANKRARQFVMALSEYMIAASGLPKDLASRIQSEFSGL
jgi:hypothetical protein